jgi:hypothetical protein
MVWIRLYPHPVTRARYRVEVSLELAATTTPSGLAAMTHDPQESLTFDAHHRRRDRRHLKWVGRNRAALEGKHAAKEHQHGGCAASGEITERGLVCRPGSVPLSEAEELPAQLTLELGAEVGQRHLQTVEGVVAPQHLVGRSHVGDLDGEDVACARPFRTRNEQWRLVGGLPPVAEAATQAPKDFRRQPVGHDEKIDV